MTNNTSPASRKSVGEDAEFLKILHGWLGTDGTVFKALVAHIDSLLAARTGDEPNSTTIAAMEEARCLSSRTGGAVAKPIGYISKGALTFALVQGHGVSTYIQAGRTDEYPVPIFTTPPAQATAAPTDLPRWIDDAKGKDPFTDDLIAEIERLRAGQTDLSAAIMALRPDSKRPVGIGPIAAHRLGFFDAIKAVTDLTASQPSAVPQAVVEDPIETKFDQLKQVIASNYVGAGLFTSYLGPEIGMRYSTIQHAEKVYDLLVEIIDLVNGEPHPLKILQEVPKE